MSSILVLISSSLQCASHSPAVPGVKKSLIRLLELKRRELRARSTWTGEPLTSGVPNRARATSWQLLSLHLTEVALLWREIKDLCSSDKIYTHVLGFKYLLNKWGWRQQKEKYLPKSTLSIYCVLKFSSTSGPIYVTSLLGPDVQVKCRVAEVLISIHCVIGPQSEPECVSPAECEEISEK